MKKPDCERCDGTGWLRWTRRAGAWSWPSDAVVRWRDEGGVQWGHPSKFTVGFCPVCPECRIGRQREASSENQNLERAL